MRVLCKSSFAVALMMLPLFAAAQQSLTLSDAVRIALDKNPLHKAALAETRETQAGIREARATLLPRLMVSEAGMRGNDPVFVFGTKLRQQRFAASDFALNQLNTPGPIGNFTSKFSGQWRIFDSFQNYRTIERARRMNDASREQLERADQELIARAVQSYYGVLLARKHVAVAKDALKTAQAIEERSRGRVESGMTVEADLLSSQVLTATRQQELIRTQNDLSFAAVQLAIVLGLSSETQIDLTDTLTERVLPTRSIPELERDGLTLRPDLRRVRSEQSAQQQSVKIAKSAIGPRVDTFGSWQTDSHSVGWNGGNSWVAGVEVQLDLFSGGAKLAQVQREKATAERIAAMRNAFEDNVRLEVRRAYYDYDAAQQQVAVARSSTRQAEESLRILQNRYDSGLATVTDLLRVEESAHRAQTDYWDAVYRTQTSYVSLELAAGTLSANSPVVTQ